MPIVTMNKANRKKGDDEMRYMIEKGDLIKANGLSIRVDKVIHCDYFYPEGYEIDFIDTYGNRRHWRQWLEGGSVVKGNKNIIRCNATALCQKYGR